VRDVVTNTSPLLYLHQLKLLELLPRLYKRIIVPSAVVMELSEGARIGYVVSCLRLLRSSTDWNDLASASLPRLVWA